MGIPRYTKKLLYEEIENLRDHIGLCPNEYPLNIKSLATARGLLVDTHPFKTIGLRGVLAIAGDSGHIILDENRSERDQNFFCGLELIHFVLHKNIGHRSFQCYEKVKEYQNSFIEWQANEGAAELTYRIINLFQIFLIVLIRILLIMLILLRQENNLPVVILYLKWS